MSRSSWPNSIRSNVRELEGVFGGGWCDIAFTGRADYLGIRQGALRDLLALQEKLVTVKISKSRREYYKIRNCGFVSTRRRPFPCVGRRQVADGAAKELTPHSLQESAGDAFGGQGPHHRAACV